MKKYDIKLFLPILVVLAALSAPAADCLADEILFGCLTGGGKVRIGCKSGQLDFKFY